MHDPIKQNTNPESYWWLADRWFRLIEMALILGVLGYFKAKTGNLAVTVIYWISWLVLYGWFTEVGELLAKRYSNGRSLRQKWWIWGLSGGLAFSFYYGISETTLWIIGQQMGQI